MVRKPIKRPSKRLVRQLVRERAARIPLGTRSEVRRSTAEARARLGDCHSDADDSEFVRYELDCCDGAVRRCGYSRCATLISSIFLPLFFGQRYLLSMLTFLSRYHKHAVYHASTSHPGDRCVGVSHAYHAGAGHDHENALCARDD